MCGWFWECFRNTCHFPSAPFPEEASGSALGSDSVLAAPASGCPWGGNVIVYHTSWNVWGITLWLGALVHVMLSWIIS